MVVAESNKEKNAAHVFYRTAVLVRFLKNRTHRFLLALSTMPQFFVLFFLFGVRAADSIVKILNLYIMLSCTHL